MVRKPKTFRIDTQILKELDEITAIFNNSQQEIAEQNDIVFQALTKTQMLEIIIHEKYKNMA